MPELNSGSQPVDQTGAVVPYRDRSTGLIIFGIFTIILGCLSALMSLLIVFALNLPKPADAPPMNMATLLPGIALYVVAAVVLVWLGIGSILARRWARGLLLIFSWCWLAFGVMILAIWAFIMPQIFAQVSAHGNAGNQTASRAAMAGVMMVTFVFMGFFFVVLPAIWTFFYSSRHVKATCDARSPGANWTDACPLPVLAVFLWLCLSVPSTLLMPLISHPVLPFFGILLSGVPAAIGFFLLASLWGYAAWLIYRLKAVGWWITFIVMLLIMVSTMLTYARHDITEMYRLMGYPEEQIRQVQSMGLFAGNHLLWMTSLFLLPVLVYLGFIKRYFRSDS